MIPRPFHILLLLLAGAVMNVGVAWAIARWDRSGDERAVPTERVEGVWRRYKWESWPETRLDGGNSYVSLGTRMLVAGAYDESGSFCLAYEVACGFPGRSIAYGFTRDDKVHRFHDCVRLPWQVRTAMFDPTGSHLPIRVVWPGFAINTLFYAAILWLLICGPFVLRRFIRCRRGLCPKCGYPVGQSSICTECGRSVRRGEAAR